MALPDVTGTTMETITGNEEVLDDDEVLREPLAVKTRGKADIGWERWSATRRRSGRSRDSRPSTTHSDPSEYTLEHQENETELRQEATAPLRTKKKVRFLIEVAPVHGTPRLPLGFAKRPPPPPPPPVPVGFFESVPVSGQYVEGLPPIPSRPAPPAPEEHFSRIPSIPLSPLQDVPSPTAPDTTLSFTSVVRPIEPILTTAAEGDNSVNQKAFRLYTRFIDQMTEFMESQNAVTKLRAKVQEKRLYLGLKQDYVRQCDEHLFHQLQGRLANDAGDLDEEEMLRLFEDPRKARDDLAPVEDYYETLVMELDADEHALNEKLGQLEYRYENFLKLHGTSISTATAPSGLSFASSSIPSTQHHAETSPPEARPRTALGESVPAADLPEASQFPDPKSSKSNDLHKLKNSTESSEARSSTPHCHSTLEERPFTEARRELREQEAPEILLGIGAGSSEGLPLAEAEVMLGTRDPTMRYEHPNRVLAEVPLESFLTENPLLLRGSDGDTLSTLSDYLLDFQDTGDRVNKWLLHKLRVSPREVFDLQRQIQASSVNTPDWAQLVLSRWNDIEVKDNRSYSVASDMSLEEHARHVVGVQASPLPYPSPVHSRVARSSKTGSRRRSRSTHRAETSNALLLQFLRQDIATLNATAEEAV